MPWVGFAIAGGLSLLTWLSASSTSGSPHGPPFPLTFAFQEHINPAAAGGGDYRTYMQIGHSLDVVLLGCLGAIIGRFLADKGDRPNP